MSFSVTATGNRTEAELTIAADPHVPETIKRAVPLLLAEFSAEKTVEIKTYGHHDGAGGGNVTLTVTTS